MQLNISDTVRDAYDSKHLLTKHPWKKLLQLVYAMELVHMDYLTIETMKGGKDIHI